MKSTLRIATWLALFGAPAWAAQESAAEESDRKPATTVNDPASDSSESPDLRERIAWCGTWQSAQREARRSQRPILLIAAAPFCHSVPGIW